MSRLAYVGLFESLRTYGLFVDGRLPISHIAHAALCGEQWAIDRILSAVDGIDVSEPGGGVPKRLVMP